jgi:hypothetical protein
MCVHGLDRLGWGYGTDDDEETPMADGNTPEQPVIDHSTCIPAGTGNARAHNHEGATGRWIWPGEQGKGLYDESPTGAGF